MPSKTAYAPAHSIHSAPLPGNTRRRASANRAHARPSARSRRLESARSEKCIAFNYAHGSDLWQRRGYADTEYELLLDRSAKPVDCKSPTAVSFYYKVLYNTVYV